MPNAIDVLDELGRRQLTLAVAESLTGGNVAAELTAIPGASTVFCGGVIAYSSAVKTDVLGVPEADVREFGQVSAAVAEALAIGVRDALDADIGVATTGVAGPSPLEGVPVGTVVVAASDGSTTLVREVTCTGNRAAITAAAVSEALRILSDLLHA